VIRTPAIPASGRLIATVKMRCSSISRLANTPGGIPVIATFAIAQVRAGSVGVFSTTFGIARTRVVQYSWSQRSRASFFGVPIRSWNAIASSIARSVWQGCVPVWLSLRMSSSANPASPNSGQIPAMRSFRT
jgi:hypothetical protein